jgi:hypothetical protein
MAILGLSSNKISLEQHLGWDLWILDDPRFFYAGIVLVVVGALGILAWPVAFLILHILLRIPLSIIAKLTRIHRRIESLRVVPCDDADLVTISQTAREVFGELAATLERNRWLAALDEKAYMKVVDEKERMVGFSDIFRLSKAGAKAASHGEFAITTCPREYLRADKK